MFQSQEGLILFARSYHRDFGKQNTLVSSMISQKTENELFKARSDLILLNICSSQCKFLLLNPGSQRIIFYNDPLSGPGASLSHN